LRRVIALQRLVAVGLAAYVRTTFRMRKFGLEIASTTIPTSPISRSSPHASLRRSNTTLGSVLSTTG